ncbi:hypothetical protein JW998_05145 [candidate division KSB1 bacterium]|nr:hypothetical protein [candidate division KSB1 bacterium]
MKNARIAIIAMLLLSHCLFSQTGTVHEPVRYIGGVSVDPHVHDGRLPYAVGVESRQTVRVNRSHPDWVEGSGWTYSHASNLCYWNDSFYQHYLSNPIDEHIAPGQTLVVTSKDGRNWSKPVVVFPPYQAPSGVAVPEGYDGYMMHQRMGFYIAPNKRLLVLAFYGHAEDPFGAGGIGRVVREAYADGTYGPIYFIRYSSHANWNETNTSYPFYRTSDDAGFVRACDDLLADKLVTAQWWDEDRGLDGFYSLKRAGSALSYYHRKDGAVVALWKRSLCALSFDDGASFSPPVKVPTLVMAGGKVWGQATDDSRYALCYNPIDMDEHRYPLIIVTSDDGIIYDDMLIVQGEVPPRRFFGRWKDYGPCYVRGIVEGNGNPPGDDMWITYSMNKEDMWVSRIPLPVRHTITGPVNDDFDDMPTGTVRDWNIYAPQWAPVSVVDFPGGAEKSLQLKDYDRYDYARAIRIFQEGQEIALSFRVYAQTSYAGMLDIDVTDRLGNRPVRLRFDSDAQMKYFKGDDYANLQRYQLDTWHVIQLKIEARPFGSYDLSVDGRRLLQAEPLVEAVKSVERLSVRTGPYRDWPTRKTVNEQPHAPLEDGDEPAPAAVFYLDDVKIDTIR